MVLRSSGWRRRHVVRGDGRPKENGNGLARTGVRCGIYTRKSTEEGLDQAFNTLDAQREAAESFINSQRQEGWTVLAQKYDDGGYTGKQAVLESDGRVFDAVAAERGKGIT
jgi:hypothetical protein